MRYLWLQAGSMDLFFFFFSLRSYFSLFAFFPIRNQWEFSFKCCSHFKREWRSLDQHRFRAEDADDCTTIQKCIRNRTGGQRQEAVLQVAGNNCPKFQHKVQASKSAITWPLTLSPFTPTNLQEDTGSTCMDLSLLLLSLIPACESLRFSVFYCLILHGDSCYIIHA